MLLFWGIINLEFQFFFFGHVRIRIDIVEWNTMSESNLSGGCRGKQNW